MQYCDVLHSAERLLLQGSTLGALQEATKHRERENVVCQKLMCLLWSSIQGGKPYQEAISVNDITRMREMDDECEQQ